jgi:hypothetical protein
VLFEPDAPWACELWPHIPLGVLEALIDAQHPVLAAAPYERLDEARLRVLLQRTRVVPPLAWSALPSALGAEALGSALRTGDRAGLASLWAGHAELLLEATQREHRAGNERNLRLLLESSPEAVRSALVQWLHARIREQGVAQPGLDAVRRWLVAQCRSRGAGFGEAYALLHDIELRLSRVARARGQR